MTSLRDDPANPRWLRKALRELPRTIADLIEQFGNAALHARPDGEEWNAVELMGFMVESERED
ncbi:MAG: hypothetical protein WC211_10650, partial [Dehalococcoidia bacterium]